MRSLLSHWTLLCAASSAAASALRHRAPDLIGVVGDVVGDAVDDLVDGAKVIISKIPLSDFGEMPAVRLEDAIQDPSLVDAVNGLLSRTEQARGLVFLRQALTNSSNATTTKSTTCDSTTLSTRIEWRDYSAADRQAFLDGISCLMSTPSASELYAPSTSRYEDLVRTHQVLTSVVHGNGLFLLWHRYFISAFEAALRTNCGFERPLPWWDETLDNGAFNQSSVFTAESFGSLPSAVNGNGVCITDGKFANLTCNIGPGSQNIPHCLSRAGNETLTVQASEAYVDYCAVRTEFASFSSCAETGPHAWAHNGIGSIMAEVSASPSDPVFFMHHLFVDHQLASWQEANSTRKTVADGVCESNSSPCTTAMTLDSVVNMNGLLPNVTVGDVLDTQSGVLCYTYDRF